MNAFSFDTGTGLATGVVLGFVVIPLFVLLARLLTIRVDEREVVLITRFGKLERTVSRPGLHWVFDRILPWVHLFYVSLRRDARHVNQVHINDARGTTVVVDLWLEYEIEDAAKAIFGIADWETSLQNLVSHTATSVLGNREFREILCNRDELGEVLRRDLDKDCRRWGLHVHAVNINRVRLLAEVSQQMLDAVAARLERAKADIEEAGRLAVAKLEAETSVRVASLVAQAKGQYPAAVGRAFEKLRRSEAVFEAYNELYDLSLVRPHRTITFRGFHPKEVSAAEAAMLAPPLVEGATQVAAVPPLSSTTDQLLHRRFHQGEGSVTRSSQEAVSIE